MKSELTVKVEWTEARWLQMLWDLEFHVRRQRLKWYFILWFLAPGLIVGFGGWTVLLSLRLFGVPLLEPEAPEAPLQALVCLIAAVLLWPLVAWLAKRFFSRLMLITYRREAAAHTTQTWQIGRQTIRIDTGRGQASLDWSQIKIVRRTPHGYWLAQEEVKGIFLPLFALQEAGKLEDFAQLLAEIRPAA